MGSQRQKNGKTRKRIENSENQIQTSEPREAKANKIRFQKNKIALKDLTNKSVITPLKNMGNTTDKEDDSDQRQSINQPFGRQTRSKVKTFVSSSPIDNHKKQTNSKNKSLLDSVTKTEHSVDSKHNEETVNVGTDWSNGVKCLRATRRTVKKPTSLPENQNTATAGDVSQTSGSPAQTSIRQIPISSPNVSETDDMDKTENPSKNGLPPTDVSGLHSNSDLVNTVPSFRMTRNMTKSHNTPTSNKSNNPKEVSPKASTKCTKSDTEETLPCQTRSQALQSSILKNGKSPQLKKKGISTASKQKRKTALEKWIEQAGEVSVLNGSSSLSGPCRKSARLSVSKLSPGKLTSTKNESKVSSPSPATKRTSKAKKVPVWRTEPKPELLHSAVDDIYGVEYDSSECKPAKKKRTRKPKKENDVFKPSKGIVAPKQTKRPLRTAAAKTEDVQKPVVTSTKGIKPPSTDKTAAKSTTPLLKAVAEKLSKMTEQMVVDEPEKEERLDDISYIYPIVNQSTIIDDVTLTENADADHSEERDKTTESGILAGDFEESQQVIQSHPDQVEAAMENLFGFEDPETYPPVSTVDKVVEKQLVKSTPIKQQTIAECFASVSPVRKVTKATRKSANRPARLDEDVARDLIRGIRPLQPAMDKQKHPSLKQYIKDVAEIDDDEETNVRNSEVPPTPPTVFSQPPRRSYSRRELRRVKRTILTVDDDDDFEPSDEEVSSKKAKKRGGGKTIHKKNKRDEEEEQWCKVMNSHFEDIEKFNLSS